MEKDSAPKNEIWISKISSVGAVLKYIHKILVVEKEFDMTILRGAG